MNHSLNYETIAVFSDPRQGFKGNPSSVILTEKEIPEVEMQAIAKRLKQPATTFLRPAQDSHTYHVRWFAPDAEIGLCGHGAGAAAVYLGQNNSVSSCKLLYSEGEIETGFFPDTMKFTLSLSPIFVEKEIEIPIAIKEGLGIPVLAMYATGNKHIVLTNTEKSVRAMKPAFEKLRESDIFGYAVTAKGAKADFVSRTLVPHVQQLEDFATGSSHAMLAPFWAERLGRSEMIAHQLSERGGLFKIKCEENQLLLEGNFAKEGHGVI